MALSAIVLAATSALALKGIGNKGNIFFNVTLRCRSSGIWRT
jgi:hypothetical protein